MDGEGDKGSGGRMWEEGRDGAEGRMGRIAMSGVRRDRREGEESGWSRG